MYLYILVQSTITPVRSRLRDDGQTIGSTTHNLYPIIHTVTTHDTESITSLCQPCGV